MPRLPLPPVCLVTFVGGRAAAIGGPAFSRWLSRKSPSILVNCVEEKVRRCVAASLEPQRVWAAALGTRRLSPGCRAGARAALWAPRAAAARHAVGRRHSFSGPWESGLGGARAERGLCSLEGGSSLPAVSGPEGPARGCFLSAQRVSGFRTGSKVLGCTRLAR